jgi:Fe-S cluster assembly protein SufD
MKEQLEIKKMENLSWLKTVFEQSRHPVTGSDFLGAYRQQQFDQFSRRGLPSRREEAWKYTDLSFLEKTSFERPQASPPLPAAGEWPALIAARARDQFLMVFINGQYAPQWSSLADLPEGVILGNLQWALETHASLIRAYLVQEIDAEKHPFASLNAALFTDGLFLYLPRSLKLDKPLHVLSLSCGSQGLMTHPRHLVILESDTQLTFTEEYRGEGGDCYFTNVAADFFVGRNAVLNYYKLQNEATGAKHLANVLIHQKQSSSVNACSFAVGGQLTRNDLTVSLQEAYATCRANGFYGLDADGQVIDNHVLIEHAAPHTQSDMDYRGVLAKQARAVFNGKVYVRPGAKKTEARQLNHNLLLSPFAEIDTKPELEIYADEVQCRHGATTGQLDEESLFYLCTRGIDRATAKMILLQAFVEAVLSEVSLPAVSEAMQELWGRHLANL